MSETSWAAYESGDTVGAAGSEDGVIVRDDEHAEGARITLERDCRIAPFAITCGIYGAMVHTRFFGSESEAVEQFDEMKLALAAICEQFAGTDDDEEASDVADPALASFVERYP